MNNQEPTNQDILDVLQAFSESVDKRFERIESTMVTKDYVEGGFEKIDKHFNKIDADITSIKSNMVTKEYLDDKLSDLRGDLVTLVRKEDYKLAAIVQELVNRNVFDDATAKRIFAMEPYAKA